MTLKSFGYILLISFSMNAFAVDEAITGAIKSSNIEDLRGLLMPGTYIRLQDKKLYSSLAQQKTKETFMKLRSFSSADIKHGIAAILKLGGAALFGAGVYELFSEQKDYGSNENRRQTTLFGLLKDDVGSQLTKDYSTAFLSLGGIVQNNYRPFVVAAATCYMSQKGWDDVRALLYKEDRYKNYIKALAVEALIARVPVFEQ